MCNASFHKTHISNTTGAPMTQHTTSPQNRKLAYHRSPGTGPGVVFLGGFMSDMEGTKALFLEDWCKAQGRAFLRFDYSGHGQSSGAFTDGCIGDWADDAAHMLENLTDGPQIVVGSSMGGWISLLLARRMPEKFAGLVTIAAAPDFTEDSMWAGFDQATRDRLETDGQILVPSGYGDPYPITKHLITDGRNQLVLRSPLALNFPVRMLQGDADTSVPVDTANRLFAHATGDDIRLTLIKGADHRFSDIAALAILTATIQDYLQQV